MKVALYMPLTTERAYAVDLLRRASAHVCCYSDSAAVFAGISGNTPIDAVVTSLRDDHGRSLVSVVAQLRCAFPRMPVVAYCTLSPFVALDIVTATRAGLTAAGLHGYADFPALLRRVIADAECEGVTDAALEVVSSRLTPATRRVVQYCVANAHVAPTVEEVATALGVRRKTVAAWLSAAELPPASTIVGWGRVLLAARLLESNAHSVERVAHTLGYDSGAALRHMLARYTGLRAAEVRAGGGLAAVLPLFAIAFGARCSVACCSREL